MKNKLKLVILPTIIILLPIAAGLILWNRLPDRVATHFDFNGNPNGYSSKAMAVFGLPLIMLLIEFVCLFVTLNDPKRKNISDKILGLVLWIAPIISLIVSFLVYLKALNIEFSMISATSIIFALLFIIIGNYLPKCRRNYTIGIKLPWTLDDEDNWNKTHRFAGIFYVIFGFICLLNVFIGSEILFLTGVILVGLIPLAYSFILYKKKQRQSSEK